MHTLLNKTQRSLNQQALILVSMTLILLQVGCSSYTLQGKVVEGTMSRVLVVGADDPRFARPGIAGVKIDVVNDPDRLSREYVGGDLSMEDGTFIIPVDLFGAGTLEYDTLINAYLGGFDPARTTVALPPSNRRLLIVLAPGFAAQPKDFDFLKDTLDASKPYREGR